MIDDRGYFDWMEQHPGPADKVYSARNSATIYLPHSAVGGYAGWASRLFSQARLPNGRYTDYAAASVHGWIFTTGKAWQHYSIFASCWASGSAYPNTNGVAFENESLYTNGVPDETKPLTPQQIATNAHIIRDLIDWHLRNGRVWVPRRPVAANDAGATEYEHNECTRFGSAPTACPSRRVDWNAVNDQVTGEDDMKPFLAWSREESKVYFVGPGGPVWIPGAGGGAGPVYAELERVFGPMTVVLSRAALDAIGMAK